MNNFLEPKINKFTDFGTSEPFVARISLGLIDLIEALDMNKEQKQSIKNNIFETFRELSKAFISLREIQDSNIRKKEFVIINQEKNYSDLYNYCWTAYKDRMPKISDCLGIYIGFIFQNEDKFQISAKNFIEKHPHIGEEFIKMVKNDRDSWQNVLNKFRNHFLQHKKSKLEDLKEIDYYFNPEVALLTFNNCWQAIEEIVVFCFSTKLTSGVKIGLINEDNIDLKCPKKYCILFK